MADEKLIDWVEAGLTKPGKSKVGLAKALRLDPSAITRILKGERQVKLIEVPLISAYIEEPAPGFPTESDSQATLPGGAVMQPGHTFPVYASAEGGPGEIIRSAEPVDWIPRPTALANVKDAYGLIIVGDSMESELEPGDTAYVNPHLPIIFDKTYIFYHEIEGTARATVKRLVRSTADSWVVRQRNPEKQFQLKRRDWSIAHRVVGKLYR
jgi:phage repressor protein C with HTH and peptisase S24 domain